MAAPSDEEIEIINQLRDELLDLELDKKDISDMQLLRWLRAKDLDVKKAEKMLRDSLKWHNEWGSPGLSDWDPPNLFFEEFPFEITGYNYNGSPVVFLPCGDWDPNKAISIGLKFEFTKYIFKVFEIAIKELEGKFNIRGYELTQIAVVTDFENFSYSNLANFEIVNLILDVAMQLDQNYPERIDAIYVINAPKIFPMFFNIIKPIMSVTTLNKMQIYGEERNEWKEAFKKDMADDIIPVPYGGTNEEIIVNQKGERDVESLLKKEREEIDELYTKIRIPRGEIYDVDIVVEKANSILSWIIELAEFDIFFSVHFNGKKDKIILYEKVQIYSKEAEKSSIVCPKRGKYTLHFDNGYSKIRHKYVYYDAVVSPPVIVEDVDEDEDNFNLFFNNN